MEQQNKDEQEISKDGDTEIKQEQNDENENK